MDRKFAVGVLRESKPGEMRVALTPSAAMELARANVRVLIETNAGARCGYVDDDYRTADAEICDSPGTVLRLADLILKVKEFLPNEIEMSRNKSLLGFLHSAGTPAEYTKALLTHSVAALARENIVNTTGVGDRLPMLAPMSRIAGREAILLGLKVKRAKDITVAVIGIGVAGRTAIKTAIGGMYENGVSEVWMFDVAARATELRAFKRQLADPHNRIHYSTTRNGTYSECGVRALRRADIIVSAVMVPGGSPAPIVLDESMLSHLKPGALTIDIAIDQGGSFAWTKGRPTPPNQFRDVGNITYAAAENIPGSTSAAVAKEASDALAKATLPYLMAITRTAHTAETPKQALYRALAEDAGFRAGLVTWEGHLLNRDIASALELHREYHSPEMFF